MKKQILLFTLTALFLCSCCENTPPAFTTTPQSPEASVIATVPNPADMFTDRDLRTEYESTPVIISLEGDRASCSSPLVSLSENTVTILGEGTFVLRGQFNGTVIVDADSTHKLQLVLDNAHITGLTGAAVYIKQADKVFLTLAQDSSNALTAAQSFTQTDENNIDAAVFSKDDLTMNGSGTLAITSSGAHGIVSKDDLVITGGSYAIQCAGHGLQANDSIRITQASLQITAGKDGIHAENNDDPSLGFVYMESGTFTIDAQGDGISAGTDLQIRDGSFSIVTGGGAANSAKPSSDGYGGFMGAHPGMGRPGNMGGFESPATDTDESTSIKGLKAAGSVTISGGSFQMDCADDAVHANTNLQLNGGSFVLATGDDGFHADEQLTICDGTITVTESYEGIEGLHITIAGGTIRLTCSDDGINAAGGTDSSGFGGGRGDMFGGRPGKGAMGGASNGSVTISGGTVYVNASGDGIDANGSLSITGGHTTVCGPTRGDTAVLDYDTSATITGGTFIGTGASNMAQGFTDAGQGILALYTGSCSAATPILVKDSDGTILLNYAPALDFEILILSTGEMVSGEAYTVSINGESATFDAS